MAVMSRLVDDMVTFNSPPPISVLLDPLFAIGSVNLYMHPRQNRTVLLRNLVDMQCVVGRAARGIGLAQQGQRSLQAGRTLQAQRSRWIRASPNGEVMIAIDSLQWIRS